MPSGTEAVTTNGAQENVTPTATTQGSPHAGRHKKQNGQAAAQ